MRKILVSAYACEPNKGSEQAVGWNIVLQLALHNEVHIITRANNQKSINEFLSNNREYNMFFHYYDTPKIFLSIKNKERGVYLYYILWQVGIIKIALKIAKKIHIDYAYHLTFGSIWLPTFLWLLPAKFIWGPIGGGEAIPNSFIEILSLKGILLQRLRSVLKWTVYINPFLMLPALKAKFILCRTPNTIDAFPKFIRSKCSILTDGAIEENIFKYKANYYDRELISLIVTSRLIHTKNVGTIVKSVALIPDKYKIRLIIVGGGPEEKNIKEIISKLNMSERVELKQFIPRKEVLNYLSDADIYLFGSLKEACNLSLLEAMAIGLPVVCLNWSGMAISTDDDCAIRLPVTTPEQMPKDMAAAIIKLIDNPELRKQMGEAGRKRVKEVFNWESKGRYIEQILEELENKR